MPLTAWLIIGQWSRKSLSWVIFMASDWKHSTHRYCSAHTMLTLYSPHLTDLFQDSLFLKEPAKQFYFKPDMAHHSHQAFPRPRENACALKGIYITFNSFPFPSQTNQQHPLSNFQATVINNILREEFPTKLSFPPSLVPVHMYHFTQAAKE